MKTYTITINGREKEVTVGKCERCSKQLELRTGDNFVSATCGTKECQLEDMIKIGAWNPDENLQN